MVMFMKNKSPSIKNLFIRKMAYSAIFQCIILALIFIPTKEYFHNNKINFLEKTLIVNDSFTTDEIGKYALLDNKYAMDLALGKFGNENKLDSIKFIPAGELLKPNGKCEQTSGGNRNYTICQLNNGKFSGITTIEENHRILGYVIASKRYNSIFFMPSSHSILIILLIIFGIFLFNILFLVLSMRNTITNSTTSLLDFISSHQTNNQDFSKFNIDEYQQIAKKFIDEHNEILQLQKEKAYYEVKKNIAEQVAHDIRSPLTAINIALSDTASVPENKRIIIRNAAKRINDIASNLLVQSRNDITFTDFENSDSLSVEPIFVVLDNIVTEKQYEYSDKNIAIRLNISTAAHHCFANINLSSFKRVLSNLINNSIEAISGDGSIDINLSCDKRTINIVIIDTGCGIPEDVLSQVINKGFSFGKNGAGLGLFYAKQFIEMLNGSLSIQSQLNAGTTVNLELFRASAPNWFTNSLNIINGHRIIILDDDLSIHDSWNKKLSPIQEIKIYYFSRTSDLTNQKIQELNADLYLIDYEFLGETMSGLEFIAASQIHEKSILVTNSFEDIAIRKQCEKLQIKMIPKLFVPFLQLNVNENTAKNTSPIIFIDDNELMRMTWKLAAEESGIKLKVYSHPDDFINNMENFCTSSIIYMDSDFGTEIPGEQYAKILFDSGYENIHLTTGYSPGKFTNMPWLKSVIGKQPPFLKDSL